MNEGRESARSQRKDLEPGFHEGTIVSALRIHYASGLDDPAKIFRAAATLSDALRRIDRDLADSVSTSIRVAYSLEYVEAGSIKSWIRTQLEETDDQDLRDLDWKRLVGRYLVKGKHLLLRWLSERESVQSGAELEPLEDELLDLAQETNVLRMPTYARLPRSRLLDDLQDLSAGAAAVGGREKVFLVDPEGEVNINPQFSVPPAKYDELVSVEVVPAQHELTLLVKRPDYLGSAQWEFVLQGHGIRAKILDDSWLDRFQKRSIDVRPGDALRAEVRAEVRRSPSGELLSIRYFVLQVFDVVRGTPGTQQLPLLGAEDLDEAG